MDHRARRRGLLAAVGALTAALPLAVGCGGNDVALGRVDGVVRLDGKPLASGKIIFQPAAGRGAYGQIGADGEFTLGTYGDSDGALIGKHKIAVIAYEGAGLGRPDPTAQRVSQKPLVPQRYLAVGTSELTYEVKAGSNFVELDLKSP
jgi:hypothetical protein